MQYVKQCHPCSLVSTFMTGSPWPYTNSMQSFSVCTLKQDMRTSADSSTSALWGKIALLQCFMGTKCLLVWHYRQKALIWPGMSSSNGHLAPNLGNCVSQRWLWPSLFPVIEFIHAKYTTLFFVGISVPHVDIFVNLIKLLVLRCIFLHTFCQRNAMGWLCFIPHDHVVDFNS